MHNILGITFGIPLTPKGTQEVKDESKKVRGLGFIH